MWEFLLNHAKLEYYELYLLIRVKKESFKSNLILGFSSPLSSTQSNPMEREGGAVTCDRRLFHRWAAATANALSPTVDRRVRRTSRDVDEAERSRRLAWLTAGRRSLWHRYIGANVDICMLKQQPYSSWLECLLVKEDYHTGTLVAPGWTLPDSAQWKSTSGPRPVRQEMPILYKWKSK